MEMVRLTQFKHIQNTILLTIFIAGNLSPVSLLVAGHKILFYFVELVKSKSNTECFYNISSITFQLHIFKDISYILVGFLTMLMNHI